MSSVPIADISNRTTEISSNLSTYRLDNELLQKTLQGKVDKVSTKEAFGASATLSRLLSKEGITDSEGESAKLHAGMATTCLGSESTGRLTILPT